MSLTVSASNDNKDFELVPEGVYIARCIRIIDLGGQTSEVKGKTKTQQKLQLSWELLEDADGEKIRMEDDRPFMVHKKYTASLHEMAMLTKDLQAWRGRKFTDAEIAGFDMKNVLGKYCMMQIAHREVGDRVYVNVETIMTTKRSPEGYNETVYFDLEEPDFAVFESLSERLQEQIKASPEWENLKHVNDVVLSEISDEPVDLSKVTV